MPDSDKGAAEPLNYRPLSRVAVRMIGEYVVTASARLIRAFDGDLAQGLLYVALLGTVGGLMLVESVRAIRRARDGAAPTLKKPGQHNWIHRLPLKMRFRASKLFVSVIPVLGLGAAIGFLSSIMGVGGGFIMVPALIYLLKVPTNVVVGTSLFQIIFVAAYTTIVHSTANQTVVTLESETSK